MLGHTKLAAAIFTIVCKGFGRLSIDEQPDGGCKTVIRRHKENRRRLDGVKFAEPLSCLCEATTRVRAQLGVGYYTGQWILLLPLIERVLNSNSAPGPCEGKCQLPLVTYLTFFFFYSCVHIEM